MNNLTKKWKKRLISILTTRETFHFNTPVEVKENWMIGLQSLEVYNSVCKTTEEINKLELFTGPLYDELSYTTLKDKVAEVLGPSDISTEDSDQILLKSIETYR